MYALPDLFAGKTHAVLCRRWQPRVKGRDWYDLVWFASRHPALQLSRLEARMVQTGHWPADRPLTADDFRARPVETINAVDLDRARQEELRRPTVGGRRIPHYIRDGPFGTL